MYWRRPLTRLELALYAAIGGVLAAFLLELLLSSMEIAERTTMEVTILRINGGLDFRLATEMLHGRSAIPGAFERNPVELSGVSLSNLHADIDSPDLGALERGYWVFDRSHHELIYLPRLHRRLATNDGEPAVHFLVSGGYGRPYRMAPVARYEWN
jgi:hypothetical protein